ncbi:MAG: TlpA family protein disulfide reductase [Chloroflexi bacterium]|nr:MAG: TlpA family protein disulfide reductase [Chloroflexota bacterium]
MTCAGSTRIGAPAPDLSLPLLDGGTQDLARERGKVVLLNFWATWCIPSSRAWIASRVRTFL